MPDTSKQGRAALVTCLLLALVTVAVYWPVIHCEFVHFDDPFYVTKNAQVQHGLTWDNLHWAAKARVIGTWHPLTWVSHMLDYQLYGLNPAGHHATNLLFHTVNSVLLFLLLRRMTGALWRSAFVAALFALHPLHVESVAWVSERKDVLSTFFWVLTIWAYVRYAQQAKGQRLKAKVEEQTSGVEPSSLRSDAPLSRESRAGARHSALAYMLMLILFALGLMSKPMLVTLPFLLLLLDFWPLRRLPSGLHLFGRDIGIAERAGPEAIAQASLGRLILEKLPLLALSVLSSVATFWASDEAVDVLHYPFSVRLENAFLAYIEYMGKMIWPTKLVVLYPFAPDFGIWHGVAMAVVLWLSSVAIRRARQCPYLFTGWFWYLGTLIPVIGLVQVGFQAMADRYTYVPSIGLFIIFAWGGYDLALRWHFRTTTITALAVLPVLACIPITRAQLGYWRDSVPLFEHALKWTSNNYPAEHNLAVVLSGRGQFDAAARHFAEAVRICPGVAESHFGLAYALVKQKKYDAALPELLTAVQIKPDYPEVLSNLGLVMVAKGQIDEGISWYRTALRKDPSSAETHYNLCIALVRKGQLDEAITELQTAIRLNPKLILPRSDLAALQLHQGKLSDAKAQWTTVLQMDPDNVNAHIGLGLVLVAEKDFEGALRHMKEAVRLHPNDAEARLRLGNVLMSQAQDAEALRHFTEAARINPTNAVVYSDLGIVLDRLGRTKEAIEQYRIALSMNPKAVSVLNNLAWILAANPNPGIRDGKEAVLLAEQACTLTDYKTPFLLGTLGAAYAEAGRFDEAVETAKKAETLALAAGKTELAEKNRKMAELFLSRQAFHESAPPESANPQPKNAR